MLEQKGPEGAFTALQTNTDLYRLCYKVEFGFLDSPPEGGGSLKKEEKDERVLTAVIDLMQKAIHIHRCRNM